jgi:hypothetical protein
MESSLGGVVVLDLDVGWIDHVASKLGRSVGWWCSAGAGDAEEEKGARLYTAGRWM